MELSENGSAIVPEYEPQPLYAAATDADAAVTDDPEEEEEVDPEPEPEAPESRWPGWPGHCVFRLIVPVAKVGSIIGRKGDFIKKMCEDTRARIRVLEGAVGTPDRIVLVSGQEEPDTPLSPAMDAVIRIFKRVSGLSESDSGPAGVAFCSIRLLVASTQAINLIGKQGSSIKSIQESSGASIRVLSGVQFLLCYFGSFLEKGRMKKKLVSQAWRLNGEWSMLGDMCGQLSSVKIG